jgi:hypothetical protein
MLMERREGSKGTKGIKLRKRGDEGLIYKINDSPLNSKGLFHWLRSTVFWHVTLCIPVDHH